MPAKDVAWHIEESARLHSRGIDRFNLGRPAEASRLHRRALRTLERISESLVEEHRRLVAIQLARVWLSLAVSDSELHGVDRGAVALQQATEIAEYIDHNELRALVHGNRGLLNVRAGRLVAARDELDSAVNLLEHVSALDRCYFLSNRGIVNLYLGDLRQSEGDLTKAAELAAAAGLKEFEAGALHNLGYLSFLQGNLPSALSAMEKAVAVDVGGSLHGVSPLDRARVLIEAGLVREADEALAEAAEFFARNRLAQDLGETELARAECALLTGDIPRARALASRARIRFKRRGSERWRRSAELVLLQGDLGAGRPGSRLAPPALRLASELEAEGLQGQARTAHLLAAEALLRAGDIDSARDAAAAAGPVRKDDPISARLHTYLIRARLDVAGGAVRSGRREIRTGLQELASHQAKFGSIDLQTASAVHGRRLADFDLSLALKSGRSAGVVAAGERARATSRRLRAVRPPADEITAGLLTQLRKTVESMRDRESDSSAGPEVASGRHRISELQRQIRERAWTTDGGGESDRPVSIPEIEGALYEDDAVMLMFVSSDDALHAVILQASGASIRAVQQPLSDVVDRISRIRADLDGLANDLLPVQLRTVVGASLRSSLNWLDQTLLGAFDLDGRELVIVPTGALSAIPWNSLPSLRGTPVVVTPSATAWLSARGVSAVAGVVTAVAGPGLAMAEDEASSVAGVWGRQGRSVVGAVANQKTFAANMVESSVLHVAAHGRHQMDSPLFSSIRLADGPLFAYELDQISRVPEHVILAACELGLATVGPGDEALGLTSVLLHWGSQCVVSGVARVADDAAASVMVDYHRRLAKGVRSSQALADSIADFDGAAPIPFVCFGAAYSAAPTSA
ncbi:CHAT domain-containing protein [Jatrophihabitans sp. GAS493]|uniref:CHAT domain-containing protein n=1 Tax=Jatrophihabitans sp. GAS493 TaxID=1907575 RepID=UPI000BC0C71E|nr:CHAT domain-containing protein [Jatrophihabitans sp. GAS493]SOD72365.1 CHAT domain-containing protein [Jatrophihabitans sp. GAS493]